MPQQLPHTSSHCRYLMTFNALSTTSYHCWDTVSASEVASWSLTGLHVLCPWRLARNPAQLSSLLPPLLPVFPHPSHPWTHCLSLSLLLLTSFYPLYPQPSTRMNLNNFSFTLDLLPKPTLRHTSHKSKDIFVHDCPSDSRTVPGIQ